MNTLLVFLIRRDQVSQLVAYLLLGLALLALELGAPDGGRLAGNDSPAAATIVAVDGERGPRAETLLR